jgi:hypothetical protein
LRDLLRGRGRAVLIEVNLAWAARAFSACSLGGKLVGATVVRADGSDAAAATSVWRAPERQLLETATELATELPSPVGRAPRHIPG